MDERLIAFIRALRGREVRVSMAESIDALRALEQIDLAERGAVQTALQSSLVKERADMAVFDELFPQFFGVDAPPPMPLQAGPPPHARGRGGPRGGGVDRNESLIAPWLELFLFTPAGALG